MEHVKEHFEEEAKEFDDTIIKLIPMYSQMIESMIFTIPQDVSDEFKVLDLGTGTGNVSKAIKEKFEHASIDCIDIAEKMIEMAKIKLEGYTDIHYYTGDFYEFEFEEKYDVVVSSLALHHIKTDDEKRNSTTKYTTYSKKVEFSLIQTVFLVQMREYRNLTRKNGKNSCQTMFLKMKLKINGFPKVKKRIIPPQ
ncbi:MAG: class I SAM-dependent methyltransferase [Methanobacterium sp. ERen5]|nr:MAG: class I SAM-dependent methyltransferase [Methanobacterium sp. ERen5]